MTRFILDITRFMSRIGRGKPTGIDRVEIAYFYEVLRRDIEFLAFAKIGKDYVLCRGKDVQTLFDAVLADRPVGRFGIKDFYRLKLPISQRKSRQFLRYIALVSSQSVDRVLMADNVEGTEFINVGHSNLSMDVFTTLKNAKCKTISVMVHDMIPLDFPEFTRDGMPVQFETKMKTVARFADRILCNSQDTADRVHHYFATWGSDPSTVVAHLGVEPLTTQSWAPKKPPYFVCLGTIEPRKNHALLFEIWEQLTRVLAPTDVPELHIIGRRGWKNEDVFSLLDASPLMGQYIFEHSDLSDDSLANYLRDSSGLLFPSFAEGFGLPGLEAAQMGVPVLCSDLPVFREVLGKYAVYCDPQAAQDWAAAVQSVAKMANDFGKKDTVAQDALRIPRWESHFRHVFDDTDDRQVIHE